MQRMKWLVVGIVLFALVSTFAFATGAYAHNAAHVHTASGICVDLGSGRHAYNPDKQDKIPGPGDQFGARWAAENNLKVYPRHCDEADHSNE